MFDARMYMNIYWYVCKVSWYQKPAMIRVCSNSKGEPMFRAASGYGWNWWVRYHSINVFVEPPVLMTSPTLQNTYVYVYVYIYTYTYTYIYTYIIFILTYLYIRYVHIQIHIYTNIHIFNMYIYIYARTQVCVYIYPYILHIYTKYHMYTQIFIYIYMQKPIHLSQ